MANADAVRLLATSLKNLKGLLALDGEPLTEAPIDDRVQTEDLCERLKQPPLGGSGILTQGVDGGANDPPDDVRTLWVSRDERGEIFKSWKGVTGEARSVKFTDGWDRYHEGPCAALGGYKTWARHNEDPMLWLNTFLNEFGVNTRERTAIELRTLVRAVWLSGVYDCLNGPSLACVEELIRRICQNVEAYHSGSDGRPTWSATKYFTTNCSASLLVPSELRSYAHKKCKEEVEAEKLRVKASHVAPFVAGAEHDDALAALPARPGAKPKPKPKGKARQLEAGAPS